MSHLIMTTPGKRNEKDNHKYRLPPWWLSKEFKGNLIEVHVSNFFEDKAFEPELK